MPKEAKAQRPVVILIVSVYIFVTFALLARLFYVNVIVLRELRVMSTAIMLLLLLGAVSAAIWLALYAKNSENEGLRSFMGAAATFLAAPIVLLEVIFLYIMILSALGIEWFPVPGSEGSAV